jgi:4-amino-4-deoxy-L-arabinose transferase-like glycosyltransferase
MSRLAARLDPRAILARWVVAGVPPITWPACLWFLLVVPAIGLRGAHYEEGATIALARGAFEDGHWLAPFLYGGRFVERPVLVSWLLGGLGECIGRMPVWLARLPAVLSLLAGAVLVFSLVRRYASARAACFASTCFLVSPMMLQKLVTAEADGVVSSMLFAGFVLWWTGHSRGGPTIGRWVAIAGLVAAAGLVKGPHPLGYFFLGIGAYLVWRREWRGLLAFGLCGLVPAAVAGAWYWSVYQPGDLALWQGHSRLALPASFAGYAGDAAHFCVHVLLEWLPAVIVVATSVLAFARRRFDGRRDLFLALVLYAGACSVVLVFWPGARTRYAMPGVLAIAAAAGVAFDWFARECRRLAGMAVGAAGLLVFYAVSLNWLVMPLVPRWFDGSSQQGELIATAIAERPAVLYVAPEALDKNVLAYVAPPIRIASFAEIQRLAPPFWAAVTPQQEDQLLQPAPGRSVAHRLTLRWPREMRLVGVNKR